MKFNYLVFTFIIFGLLLGATTTFAQTDSPEEIGVASESNLPGTLGLFWQTLKENISMLFTFDPGTEAENQMHFAEQRLMLAERFASQTANPQLQNRATQMVQRANDLLEKINNKQNALLDRPIENQNRLLNRIMEHQTVREGAFDRLENQINENQVEKIRELRIESMNKSQRLINALNNENLPEEIRQQLEQTQTRIQTHINELDQYNQQKLQIREQIQVGDPEALQQMEQLQTQRREQLQTRIQNPNETLDNNESSQTNGLNGNQMSNGLQNRQGANN